MAYKKKMSCSVSKLTEESYLFDKNSISTNCKLDNTCISMPLRRREIAPTTVANATKITALATKIQKLVAKLATRTL